MTITTMTRKGQVTIPKAVREAAGLVPGQRVEVRLEEGRAVITPADDAAERAARAQAVRERIARVLATRTPIDLGRPVEEFMAGLREPLP